MECYSEPTQPLHITLPQMLKPLLRVNYIVGTFPYKLCIENGRVNLSQKSFHYYHSLVTLFLVVSSIFANLLRMFQMLLLTPRPVDDQGKAIPILGRMIELTCAFYANFITMLILLLLLIKRKILLKYLTEMVTYSECLQGYMDNAAVHSRVRKLYILYFSLGFVTATTLAVRFYKNPLYGPLSIWLELSGLEDYIPSEVLSMVSSGFVVYLAIVKYACLGNLEVVCCAQSVCISRSMENIMEYLEGQMEIWTTQFKGLESQIIDNDNFINLLGTPSSVPSSEYNHQSSKFKLDSELECYLDQIREFNPGLITPSTSSPPLSSTSLKQSRSDLIPGKIPTPLSSSGLSRFKTTPGRALGHAARKYLSVASMQNTANSVFGNALAVNIASIVAMTVILKYLVITSFIAHWRQDHHNIAVGNTSVGNETQRDSMETLNFYGTSTTAEPMPVSIDPNVTESPSSSQWNSSYHHLETSQAWISFLGLDLSMFIRLGVTVICLGRVHQTSLQFNQVMGKAFLTANRVIDEIATTLAANGDGAVGRNGKLQVEEVTRLLMTPTQMSSILAFMNLNNANPVAYTAGGLFVFSRGLMLMIVSIIVSYLVFLLQAF